MKEFLYVLLQTAQLFTLLAWLQATEQNDYLNLGQEALRLRNSACAMGAIQVDALCDQVHVQCRLGPTSCNDGHGQLEQKITRLEQENRRAQLWMMEYLELRH
ncbi:hypothetical protein PTTG_25292 [Puccinia triticina 1-1 BBBD Race 1]|uniref:Uncharacterized protein n=1 Tax=Puccinia triticina (isolate 1-1 / race 1 (BBBD)) TaxID=630390 RepID=A0A180H530_PUCT1|nr:hypothetical protein PTTG_25292 [Puccinia triticina 1-1 BBBD Race 1]